MNIEISNHTLMILEKRGKEKGYSSTEEYINFILGQIADKVKEEGGNIEPSYSQEDKDKIKNRLQSLGYID